MNSPSPSKYPNRDGLPLSQLSPERVNGRVARTDETMKPAVTTPFSSPIRRKIDETTFFNAGLPQSPSLPEISSVKTQFRMNTDVSGLVKRFEHLDVRDREAESLERRRKQEEALSRANIAREEAETEAKKCKEELRAQKKEYEECKTRERKASRRVEILMDEMDRAKDQWSSQSSVYEKEIRRARKEAFKSSSAVLKYQEESKRSNNEANVLRTKLDLADRKATKSEEEKFTAQYQLIAVQEELEKLRASLKVAEEERERWKRSLDEKDILRIASQGSIALPTTGQEEEFGDPDGGHEERSIGWAEGGALRTHSNVDQLSLAQIRGQMMLEKRRRQAAEGLADFLQMECQFRCCRCLAHTGKYSHMGAVDQSTYLPSTDSQGNQPGNPTKEIDDDMQLCEEQHYQTNPDTDMVTQPKTEFATETAFYENDRPITPPSARPTDSGSWREVSKTTRVPMHFTPSVKQSAEENATPNSPQEKPPQETKSYPFDREAALAAIEKRRRAKSFAQSGTPKRPLIGRVNDRRDISAPAITG